MAGINAGEGGKLSGIQSGATVGAPAGTLVGGSYAENIESWAGNPAARVNAGTTTINGGKITADTIGAREINVDRLSALSGEIGTLISYNPAGGRVERDGNGSRLYDQNGVLRMRWGFF